MKLALTLAAVALASAAAVDSANAFSLSPKSTHFAATGTLNLSAVGTTVACKTKLTGATNSKGAGKISGATFTGTSFVCAAITPVNLPWKMAASNATTAVIKGVTVSGGGSSCGPSTVKIAVSSGGAFTFNNATLTGGCSINGTIQSSPAITITNP
jgi:hypothetical protein